MFTVAGNELGGCVQEAAVAFGAGALAERSAEIFTVAQRAAAACLACTRRRSGTGRPVAGALAARITPVRPLRALRDGFVAGAANPKSIVFFAVTLPEFTDRAPGHLSAQAQMLIADLLFP